MTRQRFFMLVVFVGCLVVMLFGFWMMSLSGVAVNVGGFVLTEGAFLFGLWYFVVLPKRRSHSALERVRWRWHLEDITEFDGVDGQWAVLKRERVEDTDEDES